MRKDARYFTYIADKKVDALLGQIPEKRLKKLCGTLELNLKIVKASITAELRNNENRVTRFLAVEKYLEDESRISSIFEEGHWVSGTMHAKTIMLSEYDQVVFFLADQDDPIIALGGSAKHLIGHSENETLRPEWSSTPRLISALLSHAESRRRPVEENTADALNDITSSTGGGTEDWCDLIYRLSERSKGPYETIRYIARVLLADSHRKQQVCLATPLYIAQADKS